jgi:enhancer of mRNA-decapping protein 4
VPGKAAGMVRVLRSHCSDRIILKGFHGFVRDLSFAYHDKRILVAAVDEYGYLLVHEIIGAEVKLVLQVNPDSATGSSENHRVIWCPYVPDKENGKSSVEMMLFYCFGVFSNASFFIRHNW